MSDMKLSTEILDLPQCPTCQATLLNPMNSMVTPLYCEFCWHLSIRDSFWRFWAYVSVAWLIFQQIERIFPWFSIHIP
jgi:hypothetical protein